MRRTTTALIALFLITLCSCSPQRKVLISWEHLLEWLYEPTSIADITRPSAVMLSSFDREGKNQDYNTGFRVTSDGWLEITDLRGPGAMVRLWFTGLASDAQILFLFDNEKSPRLTTTAADLYARNAGIPDAFTTTDQLCFYMGFPIPYRRRLRILVEDKGYSQNTGKFFFQINAIDLPSDQTVESASFPVPETVAATAKKIYRAKSTPSATDSGRTWTAIPFDIPANEQHTIKQQSSGGTVAALRIEFDNWLTTDFETRSRLLRDTWLIIRWEDAAEPSVRVPIGDFFGQMWFPAMHENLYMTVDENGFTTRFPMPFRRHASFELRNEGVEPAKGKLLLDISPELPNASLGYFHAGWHRSNQRGTPHEVLRVNGAGRLAGILLGVASFDRSFWVLESNESMQKDGQSGTFWEGTGLEDYFNGGWYYRTIYHEPLYGVTLKRPFRTVQYRIHLHDPVTFKDAFSMRFERGPQQTSNATCDSLAFYYLEKPAPAHGLPPSRIQPPTDEFLPHSLMTQLWDYERMQDLVNAERMTEWALRTWNYPPEMQQTLQLRLLNYRAHRFGYDTVRDTIHTFLEKDQDIALAASNLIAYFEQNAALLFAAANQRTRIFLNGDMLLDVSNPVKSDVIAIPSLAGTNILAISSEIHSWPDSLHVGLRIGDRLIGPSPETWRAALNPIGDWRVADYDDSQWNYGIGNSKGPPEMEVYPFVHPDPYVNLQSLFNAVGPSPPTPSRDHRLVLRKHFYHE